MNDENETSFLTILKGWFSREPRTRAELLELLQSAKGRLISADGLRMIEGVLQVSEMQVRDAMIPRAQMAVIEDDVTPNEALPTIIQAGHSRFPVISHNRDEVIGLLLAKDLLPYVMDPKTKPLSIRELVRPAIFIPESKRLNVLLKEFRLNRNHMAIVVDEYGGVSGLITIEDVLEEIVGEIVDEYDADASSIDIRPLGPNTYLIQALTPIQEFNQYFNTQWDEEDFNTVGGLVMQRFGHLPKKGECIEMGEFTVTVMKASKRHVHTLQVVKNTPLEHADKPDEN